jgi:lipoprotein NlpI
MRARVWVEQGYPEFAIIDLLDLVGRLTDATSHEALAAALDELIELQGPYNSRALSDEQRANAIGTRGVVLEALGERDRARSDLEQAVAGGASTWKLLETLARVYLDDGKRDEALRLAGEALDAFGRATIPSDDYKVSVILTLGRARLANGLRDEARVILEQAAAIEPQNSEVASLLEQVQGEGH